MFYVVIMCEVFSLSSIVIELMYVFEGVGWFVEREIVCEVWVMLGWLDMFGYFVSLDFCFFIVIFFLDFDFLIYVVWML